MNLELKPDKPIIICGPTAAGKTALAVHLAKLHGGELINVDSRQVYKKLDIGTNKGKLTEINDEFYLDGIKLHLVNLINPNENYDVQQFVVAAERLIAELLSKGVLPILVGGTGLYVDALVRGYDLETTEIDADQRQKLNLLSVSELQQQLPEAILNELNDSDRQNPRRLVRRIEKLHSKVLAKIGGKFAYQIIFINPEIAELESNLNQRTKQMWQSGIVKETETAATEFSNESVGLQGIGYRETLDYLSGKLTAEQAQRQIYLAHRNYAKRQLTWLRKYLQPQFLSETNSTVQQLSLTQARSALN